MSGKCWVCSRQARGYGHSDGRHRIGDSRRYPLDWVFCSRRCQDIFQRLYSHWVDSRQSDKEIPMVDPTDIEIAAMRKCLRPFGEAAGEIGFDKPLGSYSEAEALLVIEAIVTAYSEAMIEHHDAAKYPPVRGTQPCASNPFNDLKDDLPWEKP